MIGPPFYFCLLVRIDAPDIPRSDPTVKRDSACSLVFSSSRSLVAAVVTVLPFVLSPIDLEESFLPNFLREGFFFPSLIIITSCSASSCSEGCIVKEPGFNLGDEDKAALAKPLG